MPTAVTAATGLLLAGFLIAHLAGWTGEPTHRLAIDLIHVPIAAVYCLLGCRVVARGGRAGGRRAWVVITAAFACRLVAQTSWVVEDGLLGAPAFPAVADYWFLAFVPFMFVGLLLLPAGRRSPTERIKLTLDALIVGASAFMVLWYLVLGPLVMLDSVSLEQSVFSFALPVGDLLLILALARLLLGRGAAADPAVAALAAAVAAFVVADVGYGWLQLHTGFAGGMWPDLFWFGGDYLLILAAHRAQRGAPESPGAVRRRVSVSWFPYVAIALAYGLLGFLARKEGMFPLGGMIIGAILLTALVVVRQMYVLKENRALAITDPLTGLANRTLINERVEALGRQQPRPGHCSAVIVIDLDKFKPINDTYGHEAGDVVLKAAAVALRSVVRGGDTAGRLGGDEFAVVLRDLPGHDAVAHVVRRLTEALRTPVVFGDHLLAIEASVGAAVRDVGNPVAGEQLMHQADVAMYAAKRSGRAHHQFYGPELDGSARDAELRQAIDDGELVLHYQPAVALVGGDIIAVEALVRWNHPERGLVLPGAFVGAAEETGAILPMGEWVLREACRQAQRWRTGIPGAEGLLLSVNVSPRQIKQPEIVDVVAGILGETGFPAGQLVLELTEGVVLEPDDLTIARLRALCATGIRIAVDDFGTGYSALSYLRLLPVSILKIDRSFIVGIDTDTKVRRIAEAVVQLGTAFEMHVIAEGVETAEQARLLTEMGCGFAQGHHFHHPMEPDRMAAVLSARADVLSYDTEV